MGVLWFNAFVILGLILRKMKYPIRFSVVPLLLLLILSVLRMFLAIEIPGAVIILSETIYPAIVTVLRHEIISYRLFGVSINVLNIFIFVWITVTVWLTARYAYIYIGRFNPIMRWLGSYDRDVYAESLLAEIIGTDKHFHVYRNKCFSTAIATAFKPYIILPEVEFSPDELRVILLHEWKHIQDKDYLSEIIINIICFVFWWNPLVYVLRNNFRFAQELKSDQFAIANKKDFHHFMKGILLLEESEMQKANKRMAYEGNSFIGNDDGMADRLKILALRGEPRSKRTLTNVVYSIIFLVLFAASYMFVILPIFWESPDVPVSADDFLDEYLEYGTVFRSDENFLIDNGDGTFSLYIDGSFVMNIDGNADTVNWLPIRERESD
jgi:beta-lactamase regulating signal transducer with metallopeptidase domain